MPHRFEPLAALVSMLLSGMGMMLSALAALLPVTPELPILIMTDGTMRLVCVVGAVGGGLLSALILSPPKTTGRGFALKIVSSSLASVLFTPAIVHWCGWPVNVDTLLALSAGIALVGVGGLKAAVPLWEKILGKRLSPPSENDHDQTPPAP